MFINYTFNHHEISTNGIDAATVNFDSNFAQGFMHMTGDEELNRRPLNLGQRLNHSATRPTCNSRLYTLKYIE